jgi:hypothetical protein
MESLMESIEEGNRKKVQDLGKILNQNRRFFDSAVAVSLANLLFIPVWWELIFLKEDSHYYMLSAPVRSDYLAAVVSVFLVSVILFSFARLRRKLGVRFRQVSNVAFVLLLLIPLNTLRAYAPIPLGLGYWAVRLQQPGVLLPALLITLIVVFPVIRFRRFAFRFLLFLILSQVLFAAFTIGYSLFQSIRVSNPSDFSVPWSGRISPPTNSGNRVVWIIFDELDADIVFTHRPQGLHLPNFDSLAAQSTVATQAISPSPNTAVSMPALLTGVPLAWARPEGYSSLRVSPSDGSEPVDLRSLPNVFQAVSEAGFQTSIIGWYHPYCRLFPAIPDFCFWRPIYQTITGQRMAEEKTVLDALKDQIASISPMNNRRLAVDAYKKILQHGKLAAATHSGLILIHFPIPHSPVIYDRSKHRISVTKFSNIHGYLDNVALADRTIQEIREVMEETETWDRSTVIVSSDHVWRYAQLYTGTKSVHVPFLVKMPGQRTKLEVKSDFQTIRTRELVLLILKGTIQTNDQAAAWISKES